MPLFRVRLELARTKEHPSGSTLHGYEFVAPLDASGHLSTAEWKANKAKCIVRRFAPGIEENGLLKDVGRGWRFDYEDGYEDDEPLYKLDRHEIRTGEYLSVTEHDGVTRPYRVAMVAPL
jgi:hypothetical protein